MNGPSDERAEKALRGARALVDGVLAGQALTGEEAEAVAQRVAAAVLGHDAGGGWGGEGGLPDPASLPDAELHARIAALKRDIRDVRLQLADDREGGSYRGPGWRWRADAARRHLERERGVLAEEQQRRERARRDGRRAERDARDAALKAAKSAASEAQARAAEAAQRRRAAEAGRKRAYDRCFVDAAHELLPREVTDRVHERARALEFGRTPAEEMGRAEEAADGG